MESMHVYSNLRETRIALFDTIYTFYLQWRDENDIDVYIYEVQYYT